MPDSIREDCNNSKRAGGRSQNEKLLRRGKAISGAPRRSGVSQLPKPPITVGITKKKNHDKSMGSNNSIIELVITEKGTARTKLKTNNSRKTRAKKSGSDTK